MKQFRPYLAIAIMTGAIAVFTIFAVGLVLPAIGSLSVLVTPETAAFGICGAVGLLLVVKAWSMIGGHLFGRTMFDVYYGRQPKSSRDNADADTRKSHRTFGSGGHLARFAGRLMLVLGHDAAGRRRLMVGAS